VVPGALVVRADFAKEHPDDVAKFLAVYLRGWSWGQGQSERSGTLALDFYKQGGSRSPNARWNQEVRAAPDLPARRPAQDHVAAVGGASTVDGMVFPRSAKFMTETGTIPDEPPMPGLPSPTIT